MFFSWLNECLNLLANHGIAGFKVCCLHGALACDVATQYIGIDKAGAAHFQR